MRADRLLSLLLSLQTQGPMTAQELASRFGVSERTVHRDVEALSLAGIPIYAQRGTNGGIFLDEHYRTSLTGFSLAELKALFVATNSGPLRDLGLTVEASILKLLAALPSQHQQEVDRLRSRFYIDTARWFDFSPQPSLLPQLQQAVWEDRQISIRYQNYEGKESELEIEAYALVAKANVWYLIGRRPSGDYRTYRATRITALTLTSTYFDRAPDFDLITFWEAVTHQFEQNQQAEYAFFPATLHLTTTAYTLLKDFVPERITLVDADANPANTTNTFNNGWVTARVMFLSSHEALMNTLALGANVRVEAPEALRSMVLETARSILAQPPLD